MTTDRTTSERRPEDDADCARYGCEDRTHPVWRPSEPAVTDALTEIVAAYTDGDWQSFGRLIERAAEAINNAATPESGAAGEAER